MKIDAYSSKKSSQKLSPALRKRTNFSKILADLLKKKGLSVGKFAKELNTSHQNVSRWLNGIVMPRTGSLKLIADYFAVSVSALFGDMNDASGHEIPILRVNKSEKEQQLRETGEMLLMAYMENPGETFALLINDHTNGCLGLCNGDYALVNSDDTPSDGDLIVARVGNEIQIRKYFDCIGKTVLVSENRLFPPLVLKPNSRKMPFKIMGRIIQIVRFL